MPNIVVLGTGMAGFGAAYRLKTEGIVPVMYDKNDHHGGHTASFRNESGFIFDIGPHISFTKDPRIQDLFADSVDQQYETLPIHLNNYWRGHWPKHPVQLHLHGLPEDVIVKVISDFVEERQRPEQPAQNYADWFVPRIYRPNLEEVLRGALSPSAPHVHYITHFRYPSAGGFVNYLKKFIPLGNLKLNHELVSIDPRTKQLHFSNGHSTNYDGLVSSVPLPDLIRMIEGTPRDVLEASRRLACSTCVLVNLGVDREDLSDAHMTYFYDEDICFTRIGFPHMLSPRNAPPGTGSIQAEVYFSRKYKPLTGSPDTLIEPVIKDLRRCGLLRENDRVLSKAAMLLPYANIIFDLERAAALKTVHGYLDDLGIAYCGRYGDWGYMWTDESFKSGELAAERALCAATCRS